MFLKLLLSVFSESMQARFMKRRGIILGTRRKNGREVYTYMFHRLFAEVVYKNDDPDASAEHVRLIVGLKRLQYYLEREAKQYYEHH